MVEGYLIMINFIWQFIKIGIGVLLILGLSYILRILILIYKSSKKVQEEQSSDLPLCDTCKYLKYKDSNATWPYYCNRRLCSFNSSPEICNNYKRK